MRKSLVFLLLFVGLFLFSYSASAQTSGEEVLLFLDVPTIEAVSKTVETTKDVPMSTYVITREELQRWGIRNFYDIFQRVPGYSFYNLDYHGQYGPITRGLYSIWRAGFSYELAPVFDWGHTLFTPNHYKSIEVARGPAGLAWGSAAEMGLINFNFRDDLEGLETVLEAGNAGRYNYDIMYGAKFTDGNPNDGVFVGYNRQQQDYETIDGSAVFGDRQAVWRTYSLLPDTNALNAVVKYKSFKFVYAFYHSANISRLPWTNTPDAYQRALEYLVGEGQGAQRMENEVYRLQYDVVKTDNLNTYIYHNFCEKFFWVETQYQSRQKKYDYGFNTEWVAVPELFDINLGGDLYSYQQVHVPGFQSTWFREDWGQAWRDGGTNETQKKIETTNFERNLFLQGKYRVTNSFQVILGARADYQRNWKPDETIYSGPRLGLIYDVSDDLTVKYLYNDSARRPGGNESYGGKTTEENLEAHELVAIGNLAQNLSYGVTLFYQELVDGILRSSTGFNDFFNGAGLETAGLEWELKYKISQPLLAYWNASYWDAEVKESTKTIDGQAATAKFASNDSNEPLFSPEFTSFIGAEYDVMKVVKVNLGLRSIMNIPYRKLDGSYDKASVHFVDLTLRTKRFMNDRAFFSLDVLNLFDEDKGVPLFGEHAQNKDGTLPPMPRRYYIKTTINF